MLELCKFLGNPQYLVSLYQSTLYLTSYLVNIPIFGESSIEFADILPRILPNFHANPQQNATKYHNLQGKYQLFGIFLH